MRLCLALLSLYTKFFPTDIIRVSPMKSALVSLNELRVSYSIVGIEAMPLSSTDCVIILREYPVSIDAGMPFKRNIFS